ncbi:MAG: VOC family protein [Saprospiraceae bacterium]|nr:VOC family protein [Saprospiraceae bacterium]
MKTLNKLIIVLFLMNVIALSSKAQSEFSNSTIQIGVVVSDLDQAVKFYTEVIGMQKVRDFDINSDFGARSGLSGGIPFHVEVLKLEDKPEATEWKLLSFGKEAQHPKQKWIQDDTGMQYITIYVNSLEPFIERLESNMVPLLGETPTVINDDLSFILVQDPDGNFVELIGPPMED